MPEENGMNIQGDEKQGPTTKAIFTQRSYRLKLKEK